MDDGAHIELVTRPGGALLVLGGRACVPAAERLLAVARSTAAHPGAVELDAAAVDLLDGAALQILLALALALRASGRALLVGARSEAFTAAVQCAGFDPAVGGSLLGAL